MTTEVKHLIPRTKGTPAWLESFTLEANLGHAATANWTDDQGNRYHAWFWHREAGWQFEEQAYKNPPLIDGKPVKTDAPGYFQTRTLDLTAKKWSGLLAALKTVKPDQLDSLIAAKRAADQIKEAAESKVRRVAYLKQCLTALQDAEPDDLLAMLGDIPDRRANGITYPQAQRLAMALKDLKDAPRLPG